MPPKVKVSKLRSKKAKESQSKIGDILKTLLQGDVESDDYSNIAIMVERYKELKTVLYNFLIKLVELHTLVVDDGVLLKETKRYREYIFSEYNKYSKFDLTAFNNTLDPQSLPVKYLYDFRQTYFNLKESKLALTTVMVAKNILSCKLDGTSIQKNGSARFNELCDAAYRSDIELRIFNFIIVGEMRRIIDYDFCILFNNGTVSNAHTLEMKKNIFNKIIELCEVGRKVDNIKCTPEFDVSEIFPKIAEAINMFKGKLHGCDKAFDIISNSSHVFEKNCNKYIRRATKTGNPTTVFTDFVQDIISETATEFNDADGDRSSKMVMGQLKKLIVSLKSNIEQAVKVHGKTPENVKFMIDTAEAFIEEFENDTNGEIPNISELRDRQKSFKNIFIP